VSLAATTAGAVNLDMPSMMNLSWLPPIFAQASERVSGSFGELAGGATVWLAVTGLSNALRLL
jgi:hypothetical protein